VCVCFNFCLIYNFQLEVICYDDVYPDNIATVTVSISVIRNPNPPKFVDENYDKTIDEKYPLGGSVLTVRATDDDKVSVSVMIQF